MTNSDRSRALYPVGLVLEGRRCVVVGEGPLAERKSADLRECGGIVHRVDGPLSPADLEGTHLVIVTSGDPEIQEGAFRLATARGIPVNVVDVNALCTFYAPAILRRGALTVSVATEGKSPLLAVAVRDRIAAVLGTGIASALEHLGEARAVARTAFPDSFDARAAALRALVSAEAVEWILCGQIDAFEAHWESWKTRLAARA